LHPISDEGMIHYSRFKISNTTEKHKDFMSKAIQVILNTILHHRPYYYNLLLDYTLKRNIIIRAILKLVSCKAKNSRLPSELLKNLLVSANHRLVFIQHNANFIYLAIELLV